MNELSEKQIEDLKYLRNLDRIIIPSQFTYWCHSTMYKPKADCKTTSDKRCWNEIPTEKFTIKGEMSFVDRIQRINSALDFGTQPTITYANTAHSVPFQIRILQPKHAFIKSLYTNEIDQKRHYFFERGLGDGRHPKLPGNTEIYIINFSEKDDVSDTKIDIVYGVTKEDISLIADLIRRIFKENDISYNTNIKIIDNKAYEDNVPTILEKSKNRSRFFDSKLKTIGEIYLFKEAGYKEDYKKQKNINR